MEMSEGWVMALTPRELHSLLGPFVEERLQRAVLQRCRLALIADTRLYPLYSMTSRHPSAQSCCLAIRSARLQRAASC